MLDWCVVFIHLKTWTKFKYYNHKNVTDNKIADLEVVRMNYNLLTFNE